MIKKQIENDLRKAVVSLGFKPSIDIVLSIPQNRAFGDYASNIALQLSKQKVREAKQSPQGIAKKIAEKLGKPDYLEKVEVAGPGFLNFFIKPEFIVKDLSEITSGFGHSKQGKGEKVILEHTSVNPNKAMHVGHLRNAVIGDSLARILRKNGYLLEVQNYIDDTGVQVADTYVGIKYKKELGIDIENTGRDLSYHYWDLYAAVNVAYAKNPEFLKFREKVLKGLEEPDSETAKEVKEMATSIAVGINETLAGFGIFHDLLVWESDILKMGFWSRAFEILKKTPRFEYEESGKNKGTWLVRFGEDKGDEHIQDKIFVRSDGTTTYVAKDFAYNLWKFGLLGIDFRYSRWKQEDYPHKLFTTDSNGEKRADFDRGGLIYTVIDERQAYLQQVIREVFNRLGYTKEAKNLRHVSYGVVSLSAKTAQILGVMEALALGAARKAYAMAGRKGIGVKAKDLQKLLLEKVLEERKGKPRPARGKEGVSPQEIANAAIKYFILKYNSASEIIFDYDQALNIYGATGPYLQYTHARACSVLEKAAETKRTAYNYVPNQEEVSLIRQLLEWPQVLGDAAANLEPSGIATFAFDLAQLFNTFYEKYRIANAGSLDERNFRISLVAKFQLVFEDVLDTLGIVAPKKM